MKALALVLVIGCGGAPAKPTYVPPPQPKPEAAPTTTTTAPAGPTVKWGELDGPVKTITVNVGEKSLRAPITAAVANLIDKPLSRDELRDRLASVMQQKGVADVVARGVQQTGGIELVLDVQLHPIVRKVRAVETGGKAVDLDMVGELAGGRLDVGRMESAVRTLRDSYLEKGFLAADVTWKKVPRGDGSVEVVFEIVPGLAATIDSVSFSGNTGVKSDVLAREISRWLAAGSPVLDEQLERATMQISAYYWDHGYANVRVKPPTPAPGKNALVFTIEEGPIFKIGKIAITGDAPVIDHARYLKVFRVKTGDIFSRSEIAGGRTRVSDAVVATGKKNANVLPLTKVDLDKKTIDLTLEITSN